MIKVEISGDLDGIKKKLAEGKRKATYAVTEQVVKDSNFFIPKQSGALEGSSLASSDYQAGLARWSTPYARRLYYNPQYNFSTDVNPNAQGLWYEAAKAKNGDRWKKIAKESY